ncbi:MAG: hypothetical protein PUB96_01600 [Helicobacteraceae bacterium]|nr:hypothetical protein [Helicobacteraceae bacterium]
MQREFKFDKRLTNLFVTCLKHERFVAYYNFKLSFGEISIIDRILRFLESKIYVIKRKVRILKYKIKETK